MQIQTNVSLKPYNTFGIEAFAKEWITISNVTQLKEALQFSKKEDLFILGGGSNMLLTQNINKRVLHINCRGISIINEDENEVIVEAMAGENWHEFVLYTINKNWGGLENLSLIPGNVGTTPIQNIGAYGVEIKDTLVYCKAIHCETQKEVTFTNKECRFGYRDSVFKNELKNQYVITSVAFKLTKKNHKLHTSYGAIEAELIKNNCENPTIKDISDAVIAIRKSKLPDPKELGNSGSFFKNPIIEKDYYEKLQQKFPEMPHYPAGENKVKVPAGWLIEQAGFKGKRFGDAGVHKNQALVLVNYGNATGKEIFDLSKKIQETIQKHYGILIEAEVNIV